MAVKPNDPKRSPSAAAARIALIFAIIATLWIFGSDRLLEFFVQASTLRRLTQLQTIKGLFFVLSCTILLYFLIRRSLQRLRASEQAARESDERFRLLVQSVSDYAIFMLDPAGNITSWNIGAQRMKDYRAEEVIGKHFSMFYTLEDVRQNLPGHAMEGAAREGRFETEGWRVRQDGSRFWAHVVLTSLRDDAGNLRGFAQVTRDMTQRRRTSEAG